MKQHLTWPFFLIKKLRLVDYFSRFAFFKFSISNEALHNTIAKIL